MSQYTWIEKLYNSGMHHLLMHKLGFVLFFFASLATGQITISEGASLYVKKGTEIYLKDSAILTFHLDTPEFTDSLNTNLSFDFDSNEKFVIISKKQEIGKKIESKAKYVTVKDKKPLSAQEPEIPKSKEIKDKKAFACDKEPDSFLLKGKENLWAVVQIQTHKSFKWIGNATSPKGSDSSNFLKKKEYLFSLERIILSTNFSNFFTRPPPNSVFYT